MIRAVTRAQHWVSFQVIQRRYMGTSGDGSEEATGDGPWKNIEDKQKEEPLALSQRINLLEKNVESGFRDTKGLFKWAGASILASDGAKFYFDSAIGSRLEHKIGDQVSKVKKKINEQEARIEKKIDEQKARMKEQIGTGLIQLRLEINNDRLKDQLNPKKKGWFS